MRLEDESLLARLFVVACLLFGAAGARAAEVELNNLTAGSLKALERRSVTLHLVSGRDLSGVITRVQDRLVVLGSQTYVEISRIEAITLVPKVPPSRAEIEAAIRASALPVPIEVEWKSASDLSIAARTVEELILALRTTASDADGRAALTKIARVSLSFGAPASAAVEKNVLVVRCDPARPPQDAAALQSMIERVL